MDHTPAAAAVRCSESPSAAPLHAHVWRWADCQTVRLSDCQKEDEDTEDTKECISDAFRNPDEQWKGALMALPGSIPISDGNFTDHH